jgi:Domain of unknown function (DUF5664)
MNQVDEYYDRMTEIYYESMDEAFYNLANEQRKQIMQQAVKHDQDKIDWAILPIGASEEIIKVFQFGAQKYARGNFLKGEGLEYSRVLNSLLRHTYAFMRGEDIDPESGLSHLAHAGCNVYMLLAYELDKQNYNNDDRKQKVIC